MPDPICPFTQGCHEQTWSDIAKWQEVIEQWERRCALPPGHDGPQRIKSFLVTQARRPLKLRKQESEEPDA